MIARPRLIEKLGDWIFWVAIALAGYWITSGDQRLERCVVIATFAGLTVNLIGAFSRGYAADRTDRKPGLWRSVLEFVALVLVGGAGLSVLIYSIMFFDESVSETVQRTILMVASAQLGLGAIAIFSMRFVG